MLLVCEPIFTVILFFSYFSISYDVPAIVSDAIFLVSSLSWVSVPSVVVFVVVLFSSVDDSVVVLSDVVLFFDSASLTSVANTA